MIRFRLVPFIQSSSIVSTPHSILLYIVLDNYLLPPDSGSVPPLLMSWLDFWTLLLAAVHLRAITLAYVELGEV